MACFINTILFAVGSIKTNDVSTIRSASRMHQHIFTNKAYKFPLPTLQKVNDLLVQLLKQSNRRETLVSVILSRLQDSRLTLIEQKRISNPSNYNLICSTQNLFSV